MRRIDQIILHCSATKAGQCYSFRRCKEDHLLRGWADIGYHFYITCNGQVHEGRPLWMTGAHCRGFNKHSIGICYEGGIDESGHAADTRTPEQRQSLRALLVRLHDQFPAAVIMGHRDLSPDRNRDGLVTPDEWVKQCPCFDAIEAYIDLQPARLIDARSDE